MPKLNNFTVKLNIPYIGGIEGNWEPDEDEKRAAWEMYVELVTRISVVELKPNEGILREALTSLYSIFDTTRKILRSYGPSVAKPKGDGELSFGFIAIAILNGVLRPILAKWHPLLLDYESKRENSESPFEHEKKWDKNEELRAILNEARITLIDYADLLAEVAEIPSLIFQKRK